jgi:serine protease
VQGAESLNGDYPVRLALPDATAQRARALDSLRGDGASLVKRAEAAATAARAADKDRPAELRALMDTVALAKRTARLPGIAYAEPERLESTQAILGTFPPSDRNYPSQRWHYEMINLPAAMQRLTALSNPPALRPLVAVIDTGIVGDHPDLAPQVEGGYSFISRVTQGDSNTASPEDPSRKSDGGVFHGSHVAGTIGASTFDGVGVAGVAPMARLMPLRVFPPGSSATSYDIVQAILYAAGLENGSGRKPARRADVINMSLGGNGACPAYYQDAISRALAQGVIVVAAAGNEKAASVSTPANCTGVISVSALDAQRRLAPYSNSGSLLSVAAPGGDLSVATTGRGEPDGVFSSMADFDAQGRRSPSFGFLQGTSMASPHVAGVMALMRYANPAITPAQVQALLAAGQLTIDLGPTGRDNSFGWGLIDARKAVDAALAAAGGGSAPEGSVAAAPSALDFGSLRTSMELSLQLTAAGSEKVVSITPSSAALSVTASKVDAATRLGLYTVSLDRAGLTGSVQYSLDIVTSKRSFKVAVTASKASTGASSGSYGRLYVLAIDPATNKSVNSTVVEASGGHYTWTITGVKLNSIRLRAGTDNDNDGYICQGGEACGGYPSLNAGQGSLLQVNSSMSNLNFEVAPLGGLGARPAAVGAPARDGLARPRE